MENTVKLDGYQSHTKELPHLSFCSDCSDWLTFSRATDSSQSDRELFVFFCAHVLVSAASVCIFC